MSGFMSSCNYFIRRLKERRHKERKKKREKKYRIGGSGERRGSEGESTLTWHIFACFIFSVKSSTGLGIK